MPIYGHFPIAYCATTIQEHFDQLDKRQVPEMAATLAKNNFSFSMSLKAIYTQGHPSDHL